MIDDRKFPRLAYDADAPKTEGPLPTPGGPPDDGPPEADNLTPEEAFARWERREIADYLRSEYERRRAEYFEDYDEH